MNANVKIEVKRYTLSTMVREVKYLKPFDILVYKQNDQFYFHKILATTDKGFWAIECDPRGTVKPKTQKDYLEIESPTCRIVWEVQEQ